MNRIARVTLVGAWLGMAVFAKATPPPTPPIPPTAAKLKAPEIDLAAGASALVLFTGAFIWIRSRRKR